MRQSRWVAALAAGAILSTGFLVHAADEAVFPAFEKAAEGTRAEKLSRGRLSYHLDQLARAHEEGRALYKGSRPRYVDAETGRVTAVVELRDGFKAEDLSRSVTEAGGSIEGAAQDRVKVSLPPAGLRAVAADPAVRILRPPYYAQPKDVVSQGVKVIKADQFINKTGDDGTGVTVAIMDGPTFGGARQLIGSELPSDTAATPFVQNGTFTEVHGTACAEIVHDVAPGAKLVLGGFSGGDEVAWAQQIDLLVGSGVDIISHSYGFDNIAPPNGKSFWAQQADSVASRGVLFVTAAGNEGQKYHQGPWLDKNKNGDLEFRGKTEYLPVVAAEGDVIIVRWDDSFGASNHDYDLYVYASDGTLMAKSEELQAGAADPLEIAVIPQGYAGRAYVRIHHDPSSPLKSNQKFYVYDSGTGVDAAYRTKTMTLTLPGDAKGALSVGALRYSTKQLEPFSSQGPTADNRVKPDLAGPDAVVTVSYGSPFYGTSAATPHAAGAAALILSHNPGLSVAALRSALQKATASGGNSRNNQQGYGLIDLSKAN